MVEARLRQVHRGRAGRWTVAASLLAGAVTVLAACSGSQREAVPLKVVPLRAVTR